MIKHIEYSTIRKYMKSFFIALFVLLVLDKLSAISKVTPKEFPISLEEVQAVLDKYETGWRAYAASFLGEKEGKTQYIIRTEVPRELKDPFDKYDSGYNVVGVLYFDYGERGNRILFMPNKKGEMDSKAIQIKTAKVCRDLYGYESVNPIVNYVKRPVKFALVGQASKKFDGHYVVIQYHGKEASNQWDFNITDKSFYDWRFNMFK